jgi:hypothetical protein
VCRRFVFSGVPEKNEIIFIVSEPPEGGYGVAAEALGQSIFTVADTSEELNSMVWDAVICHFEEEPAQDYPSAFCPRRTQCV